MLNLQIMHTSHLLQVLQSHLRNKNRSQKSESLPCLMPLPGLMHRGDPVCQLKDLICRVKSEQSY